MWHHRSPVSRYEKLWRCIRVGPLWASQKSIDLTEGLAAVKRVVSRRMSVHQTDVMILGFSLFFSKREGRELTQA